MKEKWTRFNHVWKVKTGPGFPTKKKFTVWKHWLVAVWRKRIKYLIIKMLLIVLWVKRIQFFTLEVILFLWKLLGFVFCALAWLLDSSLATWNYKYTLQKVGLLKKEENCWRIKFEVILKGWNPKNTVWENTIHSWPCNRYLPHFIKKNLSFLIFHTGES